MLFLASSRKNIDLNELEKLDLRLSELGSVVKEKFLLILRFESSLLIYFWSLVIDWGLEEAINENDIFKTKNDNLNSFKNLYLINLL